MSTRATKYCLDYSVSDKNHKLTAHIFDDMHEAEGTLVVQFGCSTCNCSYQLTMSDHLAEQLVDMLEVSNPGSKE